ncbi:MAG: ScpA family protein [Rhodospirillaceae bacterium]
MDERPPFQEDERPIAAETATNPDDLVLNLGGFEGPIDVLLTLARDQKVDLIHISILELAEQYLVFVDAARIHNLELAADYLVMAAWLAYLKSKILLPREEEDEPSASEMADALRWQLLRLQSMQEAGKKLMELPRKGQGFFTRGDPEGLPVSYTSVYDISLYDLLRGYARSRQEGPPKALEIEPIDMYSIDDAIERLRSILPNVPDWTNLAAFLPKEGMSPFKRRSAISTTLLAILELVRQGKADVRQDGGAFSPIFLKPANRPELVESE